RPVFERLVCARSQGDREYHRTKCSGSDRRSELAVFAAFIQVPARSRKLCLRARRGSLWSNGRVLANERSNTAGKQRPATCKSSPAINPTRNRLIGYQGLHMHSDANGNSKTGIYVGRTLSILASLWMILDPVMKLLKPGFVVKATTKLGYHESTIVGIGVT